MRILKALVVVLIGLTSPVYAQDLIEVRVTGRGPDREAAITDAFVTSARQVFGTFVLARAESRDALLSRNEVLTLSQGFAESYQVLAESTVEGTILVDVQVRFARSRIRQLAADKGQPSWDDFLGQVHTLQQAQKKLRAQADLLRNLVGDPEQFVRSAYTFDLVGYEVTDVGLDYFAGNLILQATQNQLFFSHYEQLLQTLHLDHPNTVIEGLLRSPAEVLGYFTMYGQKAPNSRELPSGERALWPNHGTQTPYTSLAIVDGYRVHASIAPLLPTKVLDITLAVGSQKVALGVLKNAVILNRVDANSEFHLHCAQIQANRRHEFCRAPRGESLFGYSQDLAEGAIYINSDKRADPSLIVTKVRFHFKAPFRTRDLAELKNALRSPVIISSITEGPPLRLAKYRFHNEKEYFTLEK